jgi:hypothetical protein
MTAREALATGCTAAVVTAYLADDPEAFSAVVALLPDVTLALGDAMDLFYDTAHASLALALRRQVDREDVAGAWHACRDEMIFDLELRHRLNDPELTAAVDWLTAVLDGERWLPAHDESLHLALAVLVTADMMAPFAGEWPPFLLTRELV